MRSLIHKSRKLGRENGIEWLKEQINGLTRYKSSVI